MKNPVSDHKTDPQSPVHAPAPHRNPAAGSLSPSRKKGAVWLLSILMAISLPLSACGKKAPAEAETVSSDLSSAESFAAAQESAPEGTGEDGEAGDGINPGIEATPIPAAQGFDIPDNSVEIQTSGESFSDGGDLVLAVDADTFRQSGYAFGDIININVDGKDYTAPVVSFATEADDGQPALVDASGPVWIAMNSDSSFAETSGLALKTAAEDGSLVWSMPDGRTPDAIPVTITMSAKGKFLTAYYTRHLVFSSDRADYLSDEIYANFREIRGGAFPDGMLYRGCTPIEEYYGRTQTADEMLAKYGIRTVINLANTNEEIEARITAPDFVSPNYAGLYAEGSVGAYPLRAVYTTEEERAQIAAALRFMIDHEGPYYLHCVVGKDRTGFMAMLLSFYMGVPLSQALNDYMLTYTNIFTIEPGSDQYNAILNFFPVIDLKVITGLDSDNLSDYEGLDMVWEAENYIRGLGLSDAECALLRRKLTGA